MSSNKVKNEVEPPSLVVIIMYILFGCIWIFAILGFLFPPLWFLMILSAFGCFVFFILAVLLKLIKG